MIFAGRDDTDHRMNLTRRDMARLFGAAVFAALAAGGAQASSGIMSAPDALAAAARGEVVLVDIHQKISISQRTNVLLCSSKIIFCKSVRRVLKDKDFIWMHLLSWLDVPSNMLNLAG